MRRSSASARTSSSAGARCAAPRWIPRAQCTSRGRPAIAAPKCAWCSSTIRRPASSAPPWPSSSASLRTSRSARTCAVSDKPWQQAPYSLRKASRAEDARFTIHVQRKEFAVAAKRNRRSHKHTDPAAPVEIPVTDLKEGASGETDPSEHPGDIHAAGTPGGGTALGGLAGSTVGDGSPDDADLEGALGSGVHDTDNENDEPYAGPSGGAVGGTPAQRRA